MSLLRPETETRPRSSAFLRDETETETFLETEARPKHSKTASPDRLETSCLPSTSTLWPACRTCEKGSDADRDEEATRSRRRSHTQEFSVGSLPNFGFNARCLTFISVCNQPATQGQLSLPSLRGRSMSTSFGWERQRQVWFIPLVDERGCASITVRSLENACHTWAP